MEERAGPRMPPLPDPLLHPMEEREISTRRVCSLP